MKKTVLVMLVSLCLAWALWGCQGWNKTYGGSSNDGAASIAQAADGGFVAAGATSSYGADLPDAWLFKTDAEGNPLWNKTFGGSSFDVAHSLVATRDGGYILAGYTMSYGAGEEDVWLIKTDGAGNEKWNQTIGGTGTEEAYSVVQTGDGGYLIAGSLHYAGGPWGDDWDGLLIKTDTSGNVLWSKTFGAEYYDMAYAVVQATDGGYALAGWTTSYGSGDRDAWLLKTDADGNEQWNKTFGSDEEDDIALSMAPTGDDGYVLAGGTSSYGGYFAWLIRTDENGEEAWDRTFGIGNIAAVYSVAQAADGGYVLAGTTYPVGGDYDDILLVKTDAIGLEQWTKTIGGANYDEAYSVLQTKGGGYILAGVTLSYGAGNGDAWLIKTDASGNALLLPSE